MKTLKEKIFTIAQRENSGSSSSNRYDYQKNWAICKILELHKKTDDYLLTFEFHDDIVIFDSSLDPYKMSFYQVKTKKAMHWTLRSLVKREKGKSGKLLGSHLGNLSEHLLHFYDLINSLNFITNCKIKGTLKNEVKCENVDSFKCSELSEKDQKLITESLKEEHDTLDLKRFSDITSFKLGELDIDHHVEITKGKLASFLDENYPNTKYQIAPLYKAIFDEVKKKSNIEILFRSFDELKKKKSISRNDFNSYIIALQDYIEIKDIADSIENRLNNENAEFNYVNIFRKKVKEYEILLMQYNNTALKILEKKILNILSQAESIIKSTLIDTVNSVFELLELENYNKNLFDEDLIRTIIKFKIYEQ